ncbi:hypothetical protein V8F06_013215 [Rhypophila decipiens]
MYIFLINLFLYFFLVISTRFLFDASLVYSPRLPIYISMPFINYCIAWRFGRICVWHERARCFFYSHICLSYHLLGVYFT